MGRKNKKNSTLALTLDIPDSMLSEEALAPTTEITDPVMYSGPVIQQQFDLEAIQKGSRFHYQASETDQESQKVDNDDIEDAPEAVDDPSSENTSPPESNPDDGENEGSHKLVEDEPMPNDLPAAPDPPDEYPPGDYAASEYPHSEYFPVQPADEDEFPQASSKNDKKKNKKDKAVRERVAKLEKAEKEKAAKAEKERLAKIEKAEKAEKEKVRKEKKAKVDAEQAAHEAAAAEHAREEMDSKHGKSGRSKSKKGKEEAENPAPDNSPTVGDNADEEKDKKTEKGSKGKGKKSKSKSKEKGGKHKGTTSTPSTPIVGDSPTLEDTVPSENAGAGSLPGDVEPPASSERPLDAEPIAKTTQTDPVDPVEDEPSLVVTADPTPPEETTSEPVDSQTAPALPHSEINHTIEERSGDAVEATNENQVSEPPAESVTNPTTDEVAPMVDEIQEEGVAPQVEKKTQAPAETAPSPEPVEPVPIPANEDDNAAAQNSDIISNTDPALMPEDSIPDPKESHPSPQTNDSLVETLEIPHVSADSGPTSIEADEEEEVKAVVPIDSAVAAGLTGNSLGEEVSQPESHPTQEEADTGGSTEDSTTIIDPADKPESTLVIEEPEILQPDATTLDSTEPALDILSEEPVEAAVVLEESTDPALSGENTESCDIPETEAEAAAPESAPTEPESPIGEIQVDSENVTSSENLGNLVDVNDEIKESVPSDNAIETIPLESETVIEAASEDGPPSQESVVDTVGSEAKEEEDHTEQQPLAAEDDPEEVTIADFEETAVAENNGMDTTEPGDKEAVKSSSQETTTDQIPRLDEEAIEPGVEDDPSTQVSPNVNSPPQASLLSRVWQWPKVKMIWQVHAPETKETNPAPEEQSDLVESEVDNEPLQTSKENDEVSVIRENDEHEGVEALSELDIEPEAQEAAVDTAVLSEVISELESEPQLFTPCPKTVPIESIEVEQPCATDLPQETDATTETPVDIKTPDSTVTSAEAQEPVQQEIEGELEVSPTEEVSTAQLNPIEQETAEQEIEEDLEVVPIEEENVSGTESNNNAEDATNKSSVEGAQEGEPEKDDVPEATEANPVEQTSCETNDASLDIEGGQENEDEPSIPGNVVADALEQLEVPSVEEAEETELFGDTPASTDNSNPLVSGDAPLEVDSDVEAKEAANTIDKSSVEESEARPKSEAEVRVDEFLAKEPDALIEPSIEQAPIILDHKSQESESTPAELGSKDESDELPSTNLEIPLAEEDEQQPLPEIVDEPLSPESAHEVAPILEVPSDISASPDSVEAVEENSTVVESLASPDEPTVLRESTPEPSNEPEQSDHSATPDPASEVALDTEPQDNAKVFETQAILETPELAILGEEDFSTPAPLEESNDEATPVVRHEPEVISQIESEPEPEPKQERTPETDLPVEVNAEKERVEEEDILPESQGAEPIGPSDPLIESEIAVVENVIEVGTVETTSEDVELASEEISGLSTETTPPSEHSAEEITLADSQAKSERELLSETISHETEARESEPAAVVQESGAQEDHVKENEPEPRPNDQKSDATNVAEIELNEVISEGPSEEPVKATEPAKVEAVVKDTPIIEPEVVLNETENQDEASGENTLEIYSKPIVAEAEIQNEGLIIEKDLDIQPPIEDGKPAEPEIVEETTTGDFESQEKAPATEDSQLEPVSDDNSQEVETPEDTLVVDEGQEEPAVVNEDSPSQDSIIEGKIPESESQDEPVTGDALPESAANIEEILIQDPELEANSLEPQNEENRSVIDDPLPESTAVIEEIPTEASETKDHSPEPQSQEEEPVIDEPQYEPAITIVPSPSQEPITEDKIQEPESETAIEAKDIEASPAVSVDESPSLEAIRQQKSDEDQPAQESKEDSEPSEDKSGPPEESKDSEPQPTEDPPVPENTDSQAGSPGDGKPPSQDGGKDNDSNSISKESTDNEEVAGDAVPEPIPEPANSNEQEIEPILEEAVTIELEPIVDSNPASEEVPATSDPIINDSKPDDSVPPKDPPAPVETIKEIKTTDVEPPFIEAENAKEIPHPEEAVAPVETAKEIEKNDIKPPSIEVDKSEDISKPEEVVAPAQEPHEGQIMASEPLSEELKESETIVAEQQNTDEKAQSLEDEKVAELEVAKNIVDTSKEVRKMKEEPPANPPATKEVSEPKPLLIEELSIGTMIPDVVAPIEVETVTRKEVLKEQQELPQVQEEEEGGESPTELKAAREEKKRRRRRHTSRSQELNKQPDDRPLSHRQRRGSEATIKALFTPTPPKTPTKPPTRHDSGVEAGSTGSGRKKHRSRSDRTPEEQADHDRRKAERRVARAKLLEAESAIADEPSPEIPVTAVPKRMSSRRHSSAYGGSSNGDKTTFDEASKVLDLKRESSVRNTFLMSDKPQIKEVAKKIPIMERLRFSIDGERPKGENERKEKEKEREREREHKHHSNGRPHRTREERERDREERDKGREDKKVESPKIREARKDLESKMETARKEVAEDARRAQEKEEEDRRARREERRKRREREEAERMAASAPTASSVSGGAAAGPSGRSPDTTSLSPREREGRKEREHRHHHRREKERLEKEREEKKKNPLVNLWSSAKKVFT